MTDISCTNDDIAVIQRDYVSRVRGCGATSSEFTRAIGVVMPLDIRKRHR